MDITNSRPEEHYIRSMDDEAQKEWVRSIVDRMCDAYNITGKDLKGQLANRLGLHQSTVKSWVYNKRIPFHAMVTCRQDVNCSLDWLLTGRKPPVELDSMVKSALLDKLIEHLFNAGRYKLVESASGIEVTANQILAEIEEILNISFIEHKKTG